MSRSPKIELKRLLKQVLQSTRPDVLLQNAARMQESLPESCNATALLQVLLPRMLPHMGTGGKDHTSTSPAVDGMTAKTPTWPLGWTASYLQAVVALPRLVSSVRTHSLHKATRQVWGEVLWTNSGLIPFPCPWELVHKKTITNIAV